MGWFSPIKGHYPSLGQIDKTLPVESGDGNKVIKRGMIIEMTTDATNADGAFKVAETAANEGLLYIALQDYTDAQAGMAGTTGYEVPGTGQTTKFMGTAGVPTITGLSLSMDGEYETDQYYTTDGTTWTIGCGLTVKNGFLTPASKEEDSTDVVVAYLTGTPTARWINNATAKEQGTQVVRQGANVNVIRFRTK